MAKLSTVQTDEETTYFISKLAEETNMKKTGLVRFTMKVLTKNPEAFKKVFGYEPSEKIRSENSLSRNSTGDLQSFNRYFAPGLAEAWT